MGLTRRNKPLPRCTDPLAERFVFGASHLCEAPIHSVP